MVVVNVYEIEHAQRDSIPPYETTGKATFDGEGGAHSGARVDAGVILADDDAGLAVIVEAWPKLSADARRAMLGFVDRELGSEAVEMSATDRGT